MKDKMIPVKISSELKERFDAVCEHNFVNKSELIRKWIEDYTKREELHMKTIRVLEIKMSLGGQSMPIQRTNLSLDQFKEQMNSDGFPVESASFEVKEIDAVPCSVRFINGNMGELESFKRELESRHHKPAKIFKTPDEIIQLEKNGYYVHIY